MSEGSSHLTHDVLLPHTNITPKLSTLQETTVVGSGASGQGCVRAVAWAGSVVVVGRWAGCPCFLSSFPRSRSEVLVRFGFGEGKAGGERVR